MSAPISKTKMSFERTITLFRLELTGITEGRCGTAGAVASPFFIIAPKLREDPLRVNVDGGVELPFELPFVDPRVEDDLVVGTVPLDSLEESEVRKLAFERLRRSLKKGIVCFRG